MANSEKNQSKKPRIFNFRRLPMDFGRLFLLIFFALLPKKTYNLKKEKYKDKLKKGGILVCNHQSFIDPFLVSSCFWYRRMFFLAAEIVMKNKIAAFFLRGIGCVKIDRNISDIESINKCMNLLSEGNLLTVFPQGGIQEGSDISAIKSGVILLAIRTGVPIIPMYAKRKSPKSLRHTVVIGEPFYCSDYTDKPFPSIKDINLMTEKLLEKMNECKAVADDI